MLSKRPHNAKQTSIYKIGKPFYAYVSACLKLLKLLKLLKKRKKQKSKAMALASLVSFQKQKQDQKH